MGFIVSARSGLRTACALAITALLVPVLSPGVAAAAADPAAALPQRSCSPGETLVLPSSSSVESDGWIRVDYVDQGVLGYTEIPPAGYDFSTASDSVIAKLGLPSRPTAAADLASWTAQMKRVHMDRTRGLCDMTNVTAGSNYWTPPSPNWGGDLFYSSNEYSGAMAVITQMQVNTYCGSTSTLASWVGLGGAPYSGEGLIQTGTMVGPSFGYASFWEYIPPNGSSHAVALAMTPRQGDLILEQVSLTGSTAFLEVYDENTGVAAYYYEYIGVQILTSAEFIDERLRTTSGVYTPLMDYGWTYWRNMAVLDGFSPIWSGVYQEPTEWWFDMVNNGHYLSRTTGSYSDNHMQDHWHNCI
jgi:hypothetical protein